MGGDVTQNDDFQSEKNGFGWVQQIFNITFYIILRKLGTEEN